MEFLLSSLNSSKKIDIPLNKLGPIRKKWLAAFCILGDVYTNNPEGWNELLKWLKDFTSELEKIKPSFVVLGEPAPL
jgi:hypothetical protein